jgi:hypothetical protein
MRETKVLRNTRTLIARAVEGLTDEQLLTIPPGFRNNILWNLGHVIVTQQVLHYRLAGQPLHISEELVNQCRGGTNPAEWSHPPDFQELLGLLASLPDRLDEDYAAGRLADYQGFTSKLTGVHLSTVEEALDFDQYHEGLHYGVIATYRKLVG